MHVYDDETFENTQFSYILQRMTSLFLHESE